MDKAIQFFNIEDKTPDERYDVTSLEERIERAISEKNSQKMRSHEREQLLKEVKKNDIQDDYDDFTDGY